MRIKIKPLSVNKVWCGRRFKTQDYKNYEQEAFYLLKNRVKTYKRMELDILLGLSNMSSDVDNFAKPFIDILQNKYQFNDNQIIKLTIQKTPTKKGEEFIDFKFKELKDNKQKT